MRYYLGQTVYIPVEDFISVKWSPIARIYFRVAKCKVESVPKDARHQYRLNENGKLYYKKYSDIFDTCTLATEKAKRWADKEDEWQVKYKGVKCYRPWEDSDGSKRDMYINFGSGGQDDK